MVSWQQVRQKTKGFPLCYVDARVDAASGRQGMLTPLVILFFNFRYSWGGNGNNLCKEHLCLSYDLTYSLLTKLLSKRIINTEGSQLHCLFTRVCHSSDNAWLNSLLTASQPALPRPMREEGQFIWYLSPLLSAFSLIPTHLILISASASLKGGVAGGVGKQRKHQLTDVSCAYLSICPCSVTLSKTPEGGAL